jgi:RNA polymerase sigma-70 factor (ECF subfamily)
MVSGQKNRGRRRLQDFELIYNQYFTAVYCYARSLTRSEHDAEELTAETFFKALKAIDRFDGQGDIRVWLCQIAKHAWFNQRRSRKRELPLEEEREYGENENIAAALEDQDTARRLFVLLHRMEEPYKEVFTLRTFCEQPYAQIAALFGKTEGWARVTYHRAKTKLLTEMERESIGG